MSEYEDYLDTHFMKITLRDAVAIYRIIEHQYIPYDDRDAHEAISNIYKFVKTNELAGKLRPDSQ